MLNDFYNRYRGGFNEHFFAYVDFDVQNTEYIRK